MPEHTVTVLPRDPEHRLVASDLATFLDRVSERIAALGDGALATLRAGSFEAAPHHLPALLAAIDEAREAAQGRHDLEIRITGDARDRFYRYLGQRSLDLTFHAFVAPQAFDLALCAACGRPLDREPTVQICQRAGCGGTAVGSTGHTACWRLTLHGAGEDGIGERFVREGRRLEGTPFFEALQGAARTRLFEWHAWR